MRYLLNGICCLLFLAGTMPISAQINQTEHFGVNAVQQTLSACSGTPTSGTAAGPTTAPCQGETFAITLTGQSNATGISIQWQGSSNGTSWAPISGAVASVLNTTANGAYYYQAVVHCSNSGLSATSNTIFINPGGGCDCACTSNATNSVDTKIDSVRFGSTAFGTANNICETYTSTPNTGLLYSAGEVVPMFVRNGSCSGTHYTAYLRVFADWNGDGDFEDANETVYTSGSTSGLNTLSGFNMTIPAGQSPGIVKVRCVLRESAVPSDCGTYTYGETEDFCIEIEDVACTTVLTNLTANVNTGTLVTVGWDSEPSATYSQQIKYREVGTTPWLSKNVGPAPTNAYLLWNLAPNTSYQYRARIICGVGDNGPWTPTKVFSTYDSSPCSTPEGNFVMYHRFWDYSRVRLVTNWEPDADANGRIQVRWKQVSGTTWEQRNLYGRSFVNAKNLLPNTDYEVQWRARCSNAWTTWSAATVFTTLDANPILRNQLSEADMAALFEGTDAGFDIQVFPNPVSDILSIVSKDQNQGHIRIYDMRGQLLIDQAFQSDFNQIDMRVFQKGTYLVQVISGSGAVSTEKVFKM